MPTRLDFVTFIYNELHTYPRDAYNAIGKDKLDSWAKGEIFGIEDRWFALFQQGYDTWSLKNLILFYLNLPSLYDDFSNKKKVMGNQYREYLKIAQQVLKQSQDQLAQMEDQKKKTTDPDMLKVLDEQIQVQQSTIVSQAANVATWDETLRLSIANGEVE